MFTRDVPDYTRDRSAAKSLQYRIQKYWRERGFSDVNVYLEVERDSAGNKNYYVRSNLAFTVPKV